MFFIFFILQHLKLSPHSKSPLAAPPITQLEFYSQKLCTELRNKPTDEFSSEIQIEDSASIDGSCFPNYDTDYTEITNPNILVLQRPDETSTPITLTITFNEKPRFQFLKIAGNINLIFNAQNLEFAYLDISEVLSVKTNNTVLSAFDFKSKWGFVKNFNTINFVHLSLSGQFDGGSTNILKQQLKYLDSNSISINFEQNSIVEFSNDQMKVSVGNSNSIISIPNYNYTTSFCFNIGKSLSFGISGDIKFSKHFINYLFVNPSQETDSAHKITFGPGNYLQLNIEYSQFYGELTIDNENNFSSIDLEHLTSFTPKSKITTTETFTLNYYDDTNSDNIDCNILTKEFDLTCEKFKVNYVKKLSTKDGSNISIKLNELEIMNSNYQELEIVKGTLIIQSSPCEPFILSESDPHKYNVTVNDLQVPNDLLIQYHSYISDTTENYNNLIKTKSLSGNGKIYFRIDEYDNANYENPTAGQRYFTPFIKIENEVALDRFVLNSVYSKEESRCIQCASEPDPLVLQGIPPTSCYQITRESVRGETFYGIYQNATFKKYSNLLDSTESVTELEYHIINPNNKPPECTDNSQCQADGSRLASLYTVFTNKIRIYTYIASTNVNLSFIDHDTRVEFYSKFGASATINVSGIPQNTKYLKGITIISENQQSFRVVINSTLKFYGTLDIEDEYSTLEAKDLELNGEITIAASKCLAGKIRVNNEKTEFILTGKLNNLQTLIGVVTFDNKNCKIIIKSEEVFNNFTFQHGQWTYYSQELDQDGNPTDPIKYTFTERSKYPFIILIISASCQFTAESNCDSLQNIQIILQAGLLQPAYSLDTIDDYNTYLTNQYNTNVKFYIFKGFKSISPTPFYVNYQSSSGMNLCCDITILDNGEADDNVFPINGLINIDSDVEEGQGTALCFYITLPNKYTELVINTYIQCKCKLIFDKANTLITKSQLSKIIFNKYVDVYGLSSSLTVHLKSYFSIKIYPPNLIIQNDNKVIDLNATTAISKELFGNNLASEYTITYHITNGFLLSLINERPESLFDISDENYDLSNQTPRINIIFEDSKNIKLQNFVNELEGACNGVSDLTTTGIISLITSDYKLLDLLNEKISIDGDDMKFKDKTLVIKTYTDYNFNKAYDDAMQNEGQPVYGDEYSETGELSSRADHSAYVGFKVDEIKKNGLPGWAIALIVIGCLIIIALIILLTIYLVKKKGGCGHQKVEAATA